MTEREIAKQILGCLASWIPVGKVELAENVSSLWVYLPNGQKFRVLVEQTAPADVFPADALSL